MQTQIVKTISSIYVTIYCLVSAFIVLVYGTVYQAINGITVAEENIFSPYFLLLFNFIPFPGLKSIAYILILNLLFILLFKIKPLLKNTGIILVCSGTIVALVGYCISDNFSNSYSAELKTGGKTSLATSKDKWELVIIKKKTGKNISDTITIGEKLLKNKKTINIENLNTTIEINRYYKNIRKIDIKNNSIVKASNYNNPQKNIPGIEIILINGVHKKKTVLHGSTYNHREINFSNNKFEIYLRKKQIHLPFYISLSKLQSDKSTTNVIKISTTKRTIESYLSKPLWYKNYCIYKSYNTQSNYDTFLPITITNNRLKYFPHISTAIIFIGLLICSITLQKKATKTNNR